MLAPHSVHPTMATQISSSCTLRIALQPKALQSHSTLHIPIWTLCTGMAKQRNSPHLSHNPKFPQLESPFWRRKRDSSMCSFKGPGLKQYKSLHQTSSSLAVKFCTFFLHPTTNALTQFSQCCCPSPVEL